MVLEHNILTNCGKRYKISTPKHKTDFLLTKYLSKQDDFSPDLSKCLEGNSRLYNWWPLLKFPVTNRSLVPAALDFVARTAELIENCKRQF